jgi:ribulose-5-phosphate 4-epimerase/fuculose-1-phosphate aldolase
VSPHAVGARATDVERDLREQLAAAFRMAVAENLHEGVANHFSVLLPGGEHFLINPFGLHFSEVTASSLVVCDLRGEVVRGNGAPSAAARNIHAPLHRHLPHATAVFHTHQPWATALTMLGEGRLEWALHTSMKFYGRVGYDTSYDGVALHESVGNRLADVVGSNEVVFLGNHGVLTVGPSVAHAWDDLYFLERACQTQVLAMSTGRPLATLAPDLVERTAAQARIERLELGYVDAHFAARRRMLDAHQSDYRS